MHSNEEMVAYLIHGGWIVSKEVRDAFLEVDRAMFVPPRAKSSAYHDSALPIGHGQTISAPSVVAFMLERLEIKKGMKILELGTGSGHNTALLSYLAGSKGKVISMDLYPEVTQFAKKHLRKYKNIELLTGDGSCGYGKKASYDRIIVTAAMPSIEGHPLIGQLKKKGRLIAPVGSRLSQNLVLYSEGNYQEVLPVMFVPLVGKCGF